MQNTKEFAIFCDISAEKADMEILQGLLEVIGDMREIGRGPLSSCKVIFITDTKVPM